MKAWIGWLVLPCALTGLLALSPAQTSSSGAKRPPNFVFIQAEAQGPSSISVDMDGDPSSPSRPAGLTPNLERMAAEGMRFSDFYATCPRCTPSRASFVTGISPAKLHMTYQNEGGASRREDGGKSGGKGKEGGDEDSRYRLMRMIPPTIEPDLPTGVKTSGGMLHELGYGTAHFGKWHAGRAEPAPQLCGHPGDPELEGLRRVRPGDLRDQRAVRRHGRPPLHQGQEVGHRVPAPGDPVAVHRWRGVCV